MLRLLAAGCCASLLGACTSSVAITPPTASTVGSAADTPAATLRVHLDLLFGEHVFVIAKLAVAAAAGRQDEYHSYAGMLAANGGDVETLFRTALGQTAGGQFGDAWTAQNNFLVDYIVATVTHDQAGAGTATSNLSGTYVPAAAAVLASGIGLSMSAAIKLATDHANAARAIVNDSVGGGVTQLYMDIGAARAQAVAFGDAVAVQVAHVFADRFPGDPLVAGSSQRMRVNSLMQQQGYLMTMAGDVAIGGAPADVSAAASALASFANQMPAPAYVWTQEATLVVAYAKTGDPAIRQNIVNRAAAPLDLTDAMTALLLVIDDQRNKQFATVAADDRAMATKFGLAADLASLGAG